MHGASTDPVFDDGAVAEALERPSVAIAIAASAKAWTAVHVRLPPTLIRWAPASTISAVERLRRARTFTGFDTAWQTVRISSTVRRPGA